jgi:pyruvate/2-oxoacid:ferredoxin oxidoreductase alpha subunit/Pyruvate/2-oxoacid:ferredoxin oxidoreductase gamma subunit
MLMLPNMYKIAGELTPTVFHVAARSLAAQGLSIFGDHQDVMAARSTGFALLASATVQEAHDLALVAHAATLNARIPFLHFFDGFRTSHEVNKIHRLEEATLARMVDEEKVLAHHHRALNPDAPVMRGTAQNPDVYFQARESVNSYYEAVPGIVQGKMDLLAQETGRRYHLVDYCGHPRAESVIVAMGSGSSTVRQTVNWLNENTDGRYGGIVVRLFRPFPAEALLAALPRSVKRIAVLDRTKEPGANGEPLYQDVMTALAQGLSRGALKRMPLVAGGRYGLSSKEFTPAMVRAVFANLASAEPKRVFTVGIHDDITHLSLEVDESFDIEQDNVVRAMFFGLGADGTVGANKNTIKIIGEDADVHVQAYFVYDSKKSGSQTVSHLRFGPEPIDAPYLLQSANFIGCHQFDFVFSSDMLARAAPGATLLLNSPYPPDQVWQQLPERLQRQIVDKGIRLYTIDAYQVALDTGMGRRINTIMQVCFFKLAGVMDTGEAIAAIKAAIERPMARRAGHRGEEFRGGDRSAGPPARSEIRRHPAQRHRRPAGGSGHRADLRARRDGRDDGRPWRRPAGLQTAGRWHLPHRHQPVGEAQHRAVHPRVAGRALHPVRQLFLRLPARRDSRQVLPRKRARGGAGRLPVDDDQRARLPRDALRAAGLPGRLHRLQSLRGRLPGARGRHGRSGSAGAAAGRQTAGAGTPAREPGMVRKIALEHAFRDRLLQRARGAVPAAAVRVFRRLRRLRRNALPENHYPAVRRSRADRQRHRLLVDLRRQPADHALEQEPRGPRPSLVEFIVRGQRRVRHGLPAVGRPSSPPGRTRPR